MASMNTDISGLVDRSSGRKRRNAGISVVVPVYNEEESIPLLYEQVKIALDQMEEPWELIFVDDGSEDRSVDFIEAITRQDSRVKAIVLRRNRRCVASGP